MNEHPERCYDAGFAAGRTLLRAQQPRTEKIYAATREAGLKGWSAAYFARRPDAGAGYRSACEAFFSAGFDDGYWNRPCRRLAAAG